MIQMNVESNKIRIQQIVNRVNVESNEGRIK
jgi:hypothetical protein